MKTVLRWITLLFCLGHVTGCGGGLNCPFDPPNCCYNQLFGCGPFELPFGCDCASYGLARTSPAALGAATPDGAVRAGDVARVSSSCPGAPKRVRGNLKIHAGRSAITVRVPGYGTLRGVRRGSVYVARGSYAPVTPTCRARVRATLEPTDRASMRISVRVGYGCGRVELCAARYVGNAERP